MLQPVFSESHAFGQLVGVSLPGPEIALPTLPLAGLATPVRQHADALRGLRRTSFIGGRLALAQALETYGHGSFVSLPDPDGAPLLPPGISASISHKSHLAIALASDDGSPLGVDLEEKLPDRSQIARRVLRPSEAEIIARLPESERWLAVLLRFSIKECIYKALNPTLRRYIRFDEAEVHPHPDGSATIDLHLNDGRGFNLEGHWQDRGAVLVTAVRAIH